MSVTEETRPATSSAEISLSTPADRRSDIEAKHQRITALLRERGCDGCLIMRPENFAWMTSGSPPRGVLDGESQPALFFQPEGRWLLCSNTDTQRIFDEEIDGLGFQLKEWPWHWGRAALLADVLQVQGKKFACDEPFADSQPLGGDLARLRRALSPYEIACYRALGETLSHALEATGRTVNRDETEREVAGQIAHRLLRHGAQPIQISVAANNRLRLYRQTSFTATQIKDTCVLSATARKYGLCVRASRTIVFGEADERVRKEHEAACKVSATFVAGSWPDSVPRAILESGQRIYQHVNAEAEFYAAPQGHIIGRVPVEQNFTPHVEELLQANWAVCWHPSVGGALSCDTFVITEDGPRQVTTSDRWPLKRIRIHGAEFVRPDLLIRE
jgi:Xaa-Pro aminopeptidase